MKRNNPLLAVLALVGAFAAYFAVIAPRAAVDTIAHFPDAITISGVTDQLSVASHVFNLNGSPITGGGSAPPGTVVTNGASITAGDIAAFGSSITNVGKASAAQVTNAMGFRPVNAAGDTMGGSLSVSSLTNTALTVNRVVTTTSGSRLSNTAFGADTLVLGDGTGIGTNGLLGQIGGAPTNGVVYSNWFQATKRMVITGADTRPTNSAAQFPLLLPLQPNVVPPSGTAAYIDTAAADTKLVFSNTWTATYQYRIPNNYAGSLSVILTCNEETATSAACAFTAEVWALAPGASASMGTQSFDTPNVAFTTSPGTARWPYELTFACTNIDSMAAGNWFQLRLTCTTNTGLCNVESVQLGYDVQ